MRKQRNVMSKKKAEDIAKQMTRRNIPAFTSRLTCSVLFNNSVEFSEPAWAKIRTAFLKRVSGNCKYPAIEQMYADDQLGEQS